MMFGRKRNDCNFESEFMNKRKDEGYTHVTRFWDDRRPGPGECNGFDGAGGAYFKTDIPVKIFACSKVNQLQNNGQDLATTSEGLISSCGGFDNVPLYCFSAHLDAGDHCIYGNFDACKNGPFPACKFSAVTTGVFIKSSPGPVDCVESTWSAWSTCSGSACDEQGVQSRYRTI